MDARREAFLRRAGAIRKAIGGKPGTPGCDSTRLIRQERDETLVQAALTLALTIEHKVPDCLHLALAEREGAVLASADRKLLAAARTRGIEVAEVPDTGFPRNSIGSSRCAERLRARDAG